MKEQGSSWNGKHVKSRRQELAEFVDEGRLRDAVSTCPGKRLSEEAADLLIDIVTRYCEPRAKR